MSDTDFSLGDVVELKSGGPKMTIKGIGKYDFGSDDITVLCEWFDGPKRSEQTFEFHSLKKV